MRLDGICVIVAGMAACAAAESSFMVSDPFIWRDDAAKCYRLYQLSRASDPVGAGVMMRTSTNLVDWSAMTQVLHVPESYECSAVWAPEMHVYKGSYYIFGTICTKTYPTNCVAPMAEKGWQPKGYYLRKRLSTYVFKADRPEGPFKVWSDGPIPPRDWATLDGTFFEEDGKPYMVFCHEWTQLRDGTMDAVEMTPDLTRAAGKPVTLFRASDLWQEDASKFPGRTYVTDGPFLYRSKTGELFMLWSSARKGYLQVASRSASGKLRGPWVDHTVIYANDSGHGMVFRTFEGTLAIALHSPNHPGPQKRLRIYELEDLGHALRVGRQIGGPVKCADAPGLRCKRRTEL